MATLAAGPDELKQSIGIGNCACGAILAAVLLAACGGGGAANGPPREVRAVAGVRSAQVQWTAPATGPAPAGYSVTVSPSGAVLQAAATSVAVTGLLNGTTYTFTVAGIFAGAPGPHSAPSSPITTPDLPGAPVVTASAGHQKVFVSWTAPSDGGDAIASYRVRSDAGDDLQVRGASSTVLTEPAGTPVSFTVSAINGVGEGAAGTSAKVTPLGFSAPGAPAGVTAAPKNLGATVTWTAPLDDGGAAVSRYTVFTHPGSASQQVSGTRADVAGLANGSSYTFTVLASNSIGSGPESAPSAAVIPGALPGAPTGVSATATDGQAQVSWSAPASDGGSPITGYLVRAAPGAAQTSTGGTARTAALAGLTNGVPYILSVSAVNSIGEGPAAPSGEVTPLGAYPGITPAQLAPAATRAFRAAPDGTTLLTAAVSNYSCQINEGSTVIQPLALSVQAMTGAPVQLGLAANDWIYSADSAWIAYTHYGSLAAPSCTQAVELHAVRADGTGDHTVATNAGPVLRHAIFGQRLVWNTAGRDGYQGELYSAPLAGGTPVDLGPGAYFVGAGAGLVLAFSNQQQTDMFAFDTATGTRTDLGSVFRATPSLDGSRMAFSTQVGTSLRGPLLVGSVGGGAPVQLESACSCRLVLFSADGTRLAYSIEDGSGAELVVIHPFGGGGGADVTVSGLSGGRPVTGLFSSDLARLLLVVEGDAGGFTTFLAPASSSGAATLLAGNSDYSFQATPDLAHAVLLESGPSFHVFSGSTEVHSFPNAVLQTGAATPHLAVAVDAGIQLWPADASGSPITIGGTPVAQDCCLFGVPQGMYWVGRSLLFPSWARDDGGERAYDLIAARDDGSAEGALGKRLIEQQLGGSRVFYRRSAASGGGIWTAPVP